MLPNHVAISLGRIFYDSTYFRPSSSKTPMTRPTLYHEISCYFCHKLIFLAYTYGTTLTKFSWLCKLYLKQVWFGELWPRLVPWSRAIVIILQSWPPSCWNQYRKSWHWNVFSIASHMNSIHDHMTKPIPTNKLISNAWWWENFS